MLKIPSKVCQESHNKSRPISKRFKSAQGQGKKNNYYIHLPSPGDISEFLQWMEAELNPGNDRPDFKHLIPPNHIRYLSQANWIENDKASQIVIGRLWYGKLNEEPEVFLGWISPDEGRPQQ